MPDAPDQLVLPNVIPEALMLAVMNRCDDTRQFMVEMWINNPHLARQGGIKVAMLLSQAAQSHGWPRDASNLS